MGNFRATSALAFAFILTTACSDIEFNEPKAAVTPEPTQDQVPNQSVASPVLLVAFEALPNPNSYRLMVSVANSQGSRWIIRKQKVGAPASILVELPQSGELVDPEVEAGGKYSVELGRMSDSSFESVHKTEVQIPRDIIHSGFAQLATDIKNPEGRLFLLAGSVTSLGQHNLKIDVKEVNSENATIRNFASEAEAAMGTAGASGGVITIKATKLSGNLRVELSGERGGRGFQGPKGDPGVQGPRGPGMSARQTGWSHPEVAYWLARNPDYMSLHPAKGGRGGNGGMGRPGYPGLTGGNAGSLIIDIPGVDRSQLQIEQRPGSGGSGGEGGDGGDPGPGGFGGEISENDACHNQWGSCCPPAPQGPPGDTGPRGPGGPEGVSGNKGKITINGQEVSL